MAALVRWQRNEEVFFFTYPAQSGGILFRLDEHIVYSLLPGGEEKILTLTKLLVRGSEVTLPSSCIQRKVMLYPEPDNLTDPSFYVCIDYQRPHFPVSSVIVPVYPEVGDMILVKGDDPEPWRALVLSVQQRNNAVQVHFYVPHQRWGRQLGLWVRAGTRSQVVHFKSITGLSSGTWRSGRSVYKEDLVTLYSR